MIWPPLVDATTSVVRRVEPGQVVVYPGRSGIGDVGSVWLAKFAFTLHFEPIRDRVLLASRESTAKRLLSLSVCDIAVCHDKVDRRPDVEIGVDIIKPVDEV